MRQYLFETYMLSVTQDRKYYPGCFDIYSMIVKGGKKVATGQNHAERSSDLVEKNKTHDHCMIHAECDAILQARKIGVNLSNATMYVARKARHNQLPAMCRPCIMCQKVLRDACIRKIFYTIDENHYGKMTLHKNGNVGDKIYSINE